MPHLHIQGWKTGEGLGMGVEETQQGPCKVKQEVKYDNFQRNKFSLMLMVGEQTLCHQVGRQKVANFWQGTSG